MATRRFRINRRVLTKTKRNRRKKTKNNRRRKRKGGGLSKMNSKRLFNSLRRKLKGGTLKKLFERNLQAHGGAFQRGGADLGETKTGLRNVNITRGQGGEDLKNSLTQALTGRADWAALTAVANSDAQQELINNLLGDPTGGQAHTATEARQKAALILVTTDQQMNKVKSVIGGHRWEFN